MDEPKTAWHAKSTQETLAALEVDAQQGLSASQAHDRRKRFGPNRLKEAQARPWWAILLEQFKSFVLLILAAAAVASLAFGQWPEAGAIFAVLLLNAGIGFVSEYKAQRSMELLKRMTTDTIRIRREGREQEVASEKLLPGDIVLLDAGDLAPADMRLLEANRMRADESALTGESVPVHKSDEAVAEDAPLAERPGMLFKGTTLTEGSGVGVVVATGMDTEVGRIAELTASAEEEATPLEHRLNVLGRRLGLITVGIAGAIALIGLWMGKETMLMIETAVALGVAAVPEGLPIVATIALARGMWIMARRNAVINRLSAVETLGSTQLICTDKTGTLTENRMTMRKIIGPGGEEDIDGQTLETGLEEHPALRRIVEIGVLCNNASLSEGDDEGEGDQPPQLGDPTEVALLRAGRRFGLRRDELLEEQPEELEHSFDPEKMMMATVHRVEGGYAFAVKGAPEAVLEVCDRAADENRRDRPLDEDERRRWRDCIAELGGQGLRLLAMAEKQTDSADAPPYEKLCWLGLVALVDPPRGDVADLMDACHQAGVGVAMITGDRAETGRAIARQVGIIRDDGDEVILGKEIEEPDQMAADKIERIRRTRVFARVSPEQKLRLVQIFQDAGQVVAMTGDGVNDTPALKKADIGIAMGQRGTDAARQVSDMVLKDDAFSSIVAAIRQGRIIFTNIRKSVLFMLCTNVAEVLAVAAATVLGLPIPLRPLQILYLNVLTDVFPALALGANEGAAGVMDRPPRSPNEPVLTRRLWGGILGWAAIICACVLAAVWGGQNSLGLDETGAVTLSFLTLGMSKLWFVFNLRDVHTRLWDNSIIRNRYMWGALGFCVVLLVAAVYLPGLSGLLETRAPGPAGWGLILVLSLLPTLVGQALLELRRLRRKRA